MMKALNFIGMIMRAWESPDPRAALERVLRENEALRIDPAHAEQYACFRAFLESAWEASDREEDCPGQVLAFVLERPDGTIDRSPIRENSPCTVFQRIVPGRYTFGMDTGWQLWTGLLGVEDVVWTAARGKQPFGLAANSEEGAPAEPTRVIEVAEDGITLRVFPGIESGRLEIEVKGSP